MDVELKNDKNYVINFYNDFKNDLNDLKDYLNIKFNDLVINGNKISFNNFTSKKSIKGVIENKKIIDKNNNMLFVYNPDKNNPLKLGIFFLDLYYNLTANSQNIDERFYN
jgi:hypothetical protein